MKTRRFSLTRGFIYCVSDADSYHLSDPHPKPAGHLFQFLSAVAHWPSLPLAQGVHAASYRYMAEKPAFFDRLSYRSSELGSRYR